MSWRVSGLEVKVAKNTRSGKYYLEMPYRTSKTQKKGMPKARSSQWDDTWHTAEAARAAIPEFRGKVAQGFAPVGGGGKRTKPEKSLEAIFVSPERQSKRLKAREASTSTSVAVTPKAQPPASYGEVASKIVFCNISLFAIKCSQVKDKLEAVG